MERLLNYRNRYLKYKNRCKNKINENKINENKINENKINENN